MKKNVISVIAFFTFITVGLFSNAQDKKAVGFENNFGPSNDSATLFLDSAKGGRILKIEKHYKKSVDSILSLSSLSEALKTIKIKDLTNLKSQKIRLIIASSQLQRPKFTSKIKKDSLLKHH